MQFDDVNIGGQLKVGTGVCKAIKEGNHNLAATITPHHLALNRNTIFSGGIRPHYYCLPILKREHHRQALMKVATSGNSKFFLTISA